MQTLLAKDLRLASDVLRPALFILLGFLVGLAALSTIPESALPFSGSLKFEDSLFLLPRFFLLASGPLALLATAVTLRGDRRHGATIFAGTMPVSAARRGLSALVMLLVLTATLPGYVALLIALRLALFGDALVSHDLRSAPTLALAASAIGTAYALAASRPTRSAVRTIGVAAVLVVAAAAIGVVVAWTRVGLDGGFAAMHALEGTRYFSEFTRYLDVAIIAAVVGGGIGCAVIGVPRLFGAVSDRATWTLHAAAAIVVIAASAVGVSRAIAEDWLTKDSVAYHTAAFADLSPDELAAHVRTMTDSESRPWWTNVDSSSTRSFALAEAAKRHASAAIAAGHVTDPVVLALRAAESYDDAFGATRSLQLLVPYGDPRRLGLALDAVRQHPNNVSLLMMAWGAMPDWSRPEAEFTGSANERIESLIASLRAALERVVRAGDHPEAARMQSLLDALPPVSPAS